MDAKQAIWAVHAASVSADFETACSAGSQRLNEGSSADRRISTAQSGPHAGIELGIAQGVVGHSASQGESWHALCVAALGLVGLAAFGLSSRCGPQDPFVMDRDPCCGRPNTSGRGDRGLGWALLLAALAGVLVAAAMARSFKSSRGLVQR